MSEDPVRLPPVSTTAVGVAAIRAAESAQPAPLFVDPLAPAFVDAARSFWRVDREDAPPRRRVGALILWIRVRTRFLDEVVTDACARGCRQVVVLGAGLDARAFRLALPAGVQWFELDLPDVLEFKEQVVSASGFVPACDRVVVPTDLDGDWAGDLDRAGFDPTTPTAWLAEGLLAYLTESTREAVVDEVSRRSVRASRFGVTLASADRAASRRDHPESMPSQPGDYVALWQSDAPPDTRTWLGARGWTVEEHDVLERGRAYGLDVPAVTEPRYGARLVDGTRT
jgi:methyltransferase (TIGR00027 family)